jgi:choline dehydrogenase-like flavoprotein
VPQSRRKAVSCTPHLVTALLGPCTFRIPDSESWISCIHESILILYSILPVVGNWTQTLEDIGIPFSPDANGGDGWGGFIATSTINPSNWTRSYSRSAYIDPLPPRSNLAILANSTVTRIIFSPNSPQGNLTASSVEFTAARGAQARTVNVTKEVILAGGAIGSPQVLMLSGVGPKDVLQAVNIPVNVELPGVGQHLQDHIVCRLHLALVHLLMLVYRVRKLPSRHPKIPLLQSTKRMLLRW